jgi:hypothetical protein
MYIGRNNKQNNAKTKHTQKEGKTYKTRKQT